MKVGMGSTPEHVTSLYAIAREYYGLRKRVAIAAVTAQIYAATEKEIRSCVKKNKGLIKHWSKPKMLKAITRMRKRGTR